MKGQKVKKLTYGYSCRNKISNWVTDIRAYSLKL